MSRTGAEEDARQAVLSIDAEGHVRTGTATAAQLLGMAADDLAGLALADAVGARAAATLLACDPGGCDVVARRRDGAVVALEVQVLSIAAGVRQVRLVDLGRCSRGTATAEIVGDILREFVHAVRNPVAAALNSLDMVSRGMARPDDIPSLQRVTRNSLERIEQMVGVVHELGRLCVVHPASGNLVEVAREALGRVEAQAGDRQVAVVLEAPAALPLRCDPEVLGQALEAIVANAVEASASGAPVHVRITHDEVAREALVVVRDEGEGIASERIRSVFRLFYSTRSRKAGGVGLSLARYAVAAHGGTITLVSEPGRGTTVEVRLPA